MFVLHLFFSSVFEISVLVLDSVEYRKNQKVLSLKSFSQLLIRLIITFSLSLSLSSSQLSLSSFSYFISVKYNHSISSIVLCFRKLLHGMFVLYLLFSFVLEISVLVLDLVEFPVGLCFFCSVCDLVTRFWGIV